MRKRKRVPGSQWERYKKIINDFIDVDAGKQQFLWLKKIEQPSMYGEDNGIKYSMVCLDGLFNYNYIKTWPTNRETVSGELDYTTTTLYISKRLLSQNGYLDQYGYWDFNWSADRFILNGKVYKAKGDTQVAQANNEALLFFIILQREDPKETEDLLNSYLGPISRIVTHHGSWLIDSDGQMIRNFCNMPLRVDDPQIEKIILRNG